MRTAAQAATPFFRAGLASLLLLAVTSPAPSQTNTLTAVLQTDPPVKGPIGCFQHRGRLYCSLNDLAELLSFQTYTNEQARKLEVKKQPFRLKVSADNPFLILTDQTGRRTIVQLQANVVYAASAFFVPLKSFLPSLERAAGMRSDFDPSTRTVTFAPIARNTPFDITTVVLEPKANGMLIRIPSVRPLADFESWLRQDGWLYVTISDANADISALNKLKPSGLIREVIAIQSPGSLQLTFKLSGKVATSEIFRDEATNEILVSLRTPGSEDKILLEKKRREMQAELNAQRKRWKLDVIVIDAGHGGHDTGTIGLSHVREKDIALKIALKFGRLLERNLKEVKVVYTRKDDRFVELDRRGQIANEAEGKLFVSIHCNSMRRKPSPTRGFEVYLLRPGRTQEAIEIAERENAVIELEEGYKERYRELTEENFILVTMAQSAYLKASEVFADLVQQQLEDHVAIPNRGIKQAGFYVLVGAAMPKILVETAYLSNKEDERFLRTDTGQQKIAEALYKAVKQYKEQYEKLLLEGKELGVR